MEKNGIKTVPYFQNRTKNVPFKIVGTRIDEVEKIDNPILTRLSQFFFSVYGIVFIFLIIIEIGDKAY